MYITQSPLTPEENIWLYSSNAVCLQFAAEQVFHLDLLKCFFLLLLLNKVTWTKTVQLWLSHNELKDATAPLCPSLT